MCASRGTPLISKHAKHSCAPEMVPRLPIFHSMVALALNDSANHNNNNDKNKIILKEERKGRRSLVFTTPVIRKLENCTKRAFRRFAVLGFLTEIRQTHSNQPTRLFHFKRLDVLTAICLQFATSSRALSLAENDDNKDVAAKSNTAAAQHNKDLSSGGATPVQPYSSFPPSSLAHPLPICSSISGVRSLAICRGPVHGAPISPREQW